MNDETITVKEMLRYMDSPMEFSLVTVTANKQTKTGGEWLELKHAWGHRGQTLRERMMLEKTQQMEKRWRRNANHYENSTRNVRLPNGDIITVHIRLIRRFNGKTVL